MKHKALAILMFVAAISQIACDDKPDPAKCAADPTCKAGVMAMAGPQLFPLSAAAGAQVPGAVVPGQPVPVFRVSSALAKAGVTDGAVKAQSMKVAAAIAADDQNPNSTYWKSPTPEIPTAAAAAAAAGKSTASTASIESIPQASGATDTGEAAR